MEIRRFEKEDAAELAEVIAKTLRTTNIKDYTQEYIENDISFLTAEKLIERSGWMHLYVVCDGVRIIGCGAIGPYWGREDESSLYTIFVLPEYQGRVLSEGKTHRSTCVHYSGGVLSENWV